MHILDWRDPSITCGSLGNIASHALATEFIRDVLCHDVGVLISGWHSRVWDLCVPQDRILTEVISGDTVHVCKSHRSEHLAGNMTWVGASVHDAGYAMPADHLLSPRTCWLHDPDARTVLLYPREYDNKNRTFTLDYWIAVSKSLRERGWRIAAMLDSDPSHRDGEISLAWCRDYVAAVSPDYTFRPTVNGLQAAVGMSSLAIGRGNGPAWLMLKSTIPQVVLDDPSEKYPDQSATANMPRTCWESPGAPFKG